MQNFGRITDASASDGTAHVSDSYSKFNATRAGVELCSNAA